MDAQLIILLLVTGLVLPVAWGVGRELWEGRGGRRARILVINDHDPHLDWLVTTLSEHGYRPQPCHPAAAEGQIRDGGYWLILMGLALRDLNASELLALVDADSPGSQVIFVGDPTDPLADEALERGACAVLDRRLPPPVMLARVRTLLQSRASSRRSRQRAGTAPAPAL